MEEDDDDDVSHTNSDSDCVAFVKNFIHVVVRVMVAMVVDYPIPCGNKNNVITWHPLFVLHCRQSHSHCDRCIHMNKVSATCAS
jgi:hypothetical protein